MENKAFVFTGIAFLMIIPSIILAASFVSMQRTGDTAIATKVYSDRVFYAHANIQTNFESTGKSLVTNYACADDYIRGYLNGTWAPYIEQDLAAALGVNITLPEDEINVSYDATDEVMTMGHLIPSQGIPINITDAEGNVRLDLLLGPINVSTTIGPSYYCVDSDGDEYNASGGCNCGGPVDCNDTSNITYPGALELCNGLDDDCDASTNENSTIGMNVSAPLEACGTFSVNASYRWDCNETSSATLYYNTTPTGGWTSLGLMADLIDRSQKVFFKDVIFLSDGQYTFNVTFIDADAWVYANESVIFSNASGQLNTTYGATCCPKESKATIEPVCKIQCDTNPPKYNISFIITLRDWNDDLIDADALPGGVAVDTAGDTSPNVENPSTGIYYYNSSLCVGGTSNDDYQATITSTAGTCSEAFTVQVSSYSPNYIDTCS